MDPVPTIREVFDLRWFVQSRQSCEQAVSHAAEGGSDAENLVHVLVHKVQALVHQVGDLEKGGGDEDGDHAGRLEARLVRWLRVLRPTHQPVKYLDVAVD